MRVLLIIPALDEERSLAGLLAEIRELSAAELGASIETVVVDDGSTDTTSQVARAGGARVLRLCRNLGIGGAVQAGIRLAHREGFDFAVQVDGDGQHPPGELRTLLAAATGPERPDLVVGTRYHPDNTGFRSTALRRLGSWWLRMVLRFIARVRVSDPTSGFRLYAPRALKLFDESYPYDYPEPESLAVARVQGLTILETPVRMRARQGGRSSIAGFGPFYYMLKVTLAIVLTYMHARHRRSRGEARHAA